MIVSIWHQITRIYFSNLYNLILFAFGFLVYIVDVVTLTWSSYELCITTFLFCIFFDRNPRCCPCWGVYDTFSIHWEDMSSNCEDRSILSPHLLIAVFLAQFFFNSSGRISSQWLFSFKFWRASQVYGVWRNEYQYWRYFKFLHWIYIQSINSPWPYFSNAFFDQPVSKMKKTSKFWTEKSLERNTPE